MNTLKRKIFLIPLFLIFLASYAFAKVEFPPPKGFVNDYAGILDSQTFIKLENLCKMLKEKTSVELAIAIVKSVSPLDSKMYAVKLFENWKIGERGKDNGILILLAMEERRIEIEVGYGLEGIINDAKAGQILDEYVIPYFKRGEFGEGLYNGAVAISELLIKSYGGEVKLENGGKLNENFIDMVIIFSFIILIFISVFASGIASGLFGAFFGGIIGYVFFGILGAIIGALIGFMLSFTRFPTSGGFGGGYGSFGGWGGGFGGFSGGRSGGGGAGRGF